MSNEKIETIDQHIDNLKRNVAAYRKSYKLCGNVYKAFQIVAGLMGCSAVLALVPAVPIFVVIAGAIPAGITVLLNKTHIEEKKAYYKAQHRNFKQLLSETKKMGVQNEINQNEVIKSIFF